MPKFTITIISNDSEWQDRNLSRFVCLYYFLGLINVALKTSFKLSDTSWNITSLLFTGMLSVLFLSCLNSMLQKKFTLFISIEIIMVIIYGMSFLQRNAANDMLFSSGVTSTMIAIPIGVAVVSVNDKRIIYSYLLKYSYIALLVSFVYLTTSSATSESSYSMSFATYILIFVIIQWNELLSRANRKMLTIVSAIYGLIFLFLYGNRGALLSVIFFIALKMLKCNRGGKNRIYVLMIVIVGTIISYNFEKIIFSISNVLDASGRSSYSVTRLIEGSFFESTSRRQLISYYWELIKEKPLSGWGVNGGIISEGLGPHNIVIEALLYFGFIIGGILVVFYIMSVLKVVFAKAKQGIEYDLLLIYTAAIIMKFISSGQFLTTPNLFVFIFLCWSRKSDNYRNCSKILDYRQNDERLAAQADRCDKDDNYLTNSN